MLELINVKKVYTTKAGDTAALNGVSITFPKTGMVFITGKSGSGKTTMLNVIGGLDGIDEGEIVIEGKKFSEFTSADYDSYRNTFVGFIFQEYNLLPEYSVAKNIGMANELQGKKVDDLELENLLELVDIAGYGTRKISQLSGGQKQRVAIARALIKNPQIIMADEPTGALDSVTGIQVMETLKKLSKQKLIIVVSHDLELAEKYGDRIVKLVDGQIVEDISLVDVEFNGSLYENDSEVTIKSGGDLTQEETETLVGAIKAQKKITIADTIAIRERRQTKKIKAEVPKEPVKLINSKMKLKTAVDLGLKSLFVKPVRLAITVFLSVIAFAVFGLFDSVASFTGSRIVASSLKNEAYPTITLNATINGGGYSGEKLKLSQSYIDELNKKTGYNFRGVYDINDSENVDLMTGRPYVNKTYSIQSIVISSPGTRGIDNPQGVGLNYYNLKVSGYVEFKNSEINKETGVIDEGGFNYKIMDYENSAYPVYSTNDNNLGNEADPNAVKGEILQVAISNHTADAICYWHNKMGRYDEKLEPKDLIGKHIFLSSSSSKAHLITAIIDCGEIPEKYDVLKTIVSSDKTLMLEKDLYTYLNSCGFLNLFVGEGFIEGAQRKNNRVVTYIDSYLDTQYSANISGPSDKSHISSFRYYNENEFTSENVLLFDLGKDKNPIAPQLKEDEALIHINNLEALFKNEFNVVYEESKYSEALTLALRAITTMRKSAEYPAKREAMNTFNEQLDILFEYLNDRMPGLYDNNNDNARDLKTITIQTRIDGDLIQEQTKVFKIKGVYFNVNNDLRVSPTNRSNIGALVLSEKALKSIGVTLEQGHFSKIIAPSIQNNKSTNALASYMTIDDGIKLNWHENNVLNSVEEARYVVKQFSDLFLYAGLALAVFAVFMLFNYISTSIISKRQSIGILRALGADGKNIFEMFITESLIISIINGIFASIVAYFACQIVNDYVVNIMNIPLTFALFGLRQVIVIVCVSLVTGILSSLLPIIKIAREKPVELIRKV